MNGYVMAEVLRDAVAGDILEERVGDWQIISEYPQLFKLIHPRAEYYFDAGAISDGVIKIENYHRIANKGSGTPTLREIENAFQILAENIGMTFWLYFKDVKDQPDTQRWLEKNGYEMMFGRYTKVFETISKGF